MESEKLNVNSKKLSSRDNIEYDLVAIKARLKNDPAYMKRVRERTDHYFTGKVVSVEKLKQA